MDVTLKKNKALKELSEKTGKDIVELSEHILRKSIEAGVLAGVKEDAGELLVKYFADETYKSCAATLFCIGKCTKELESLFKGLVVWGKPDKQFNHVGECPLCGCSLYLDGEYSQPDWDDGSVEVFWEKEICSNPCCGYENMLEDNDPTNYCIEEKC